MERSRGTVASRTPGSRQVAERAVKLAKSRGSWENVTVRGTARTWDQDADRTPSCDADKEKQR